MIISRGMRRGRRLGARSTLLRGQSRGHVSGRFPHSVHADLRVPLPHVREHVHGVPPDEPVLDADHLPRWARRHRPPPSGGRCHALRIRNPCVDPGPVRRRVLRGRLRLRGALIVAATTLVEQLLDHGRDEYGIPFPGQAASRAFLAVPRVAQQAAKGHKAARLSERGSAGSADSCGRRMTTKTPSTADLGRPCAPRNAALLMKRSSPGEGPTPCGCRTLPPGADRAGRRRRLRPG